MQNARENPLAAAAAAAAVSGDGAPLPQANSNNAENLLDIDFDGAAPASAQKSPLSGMSGLEGLAGTPQRVASPEGPSTKMSSGGGNLDDLMGLSNGGGATAFGQQAANSNGMMGMMGTMSNEDVLGGFASLDMAAASQPPPPAQQLQGGGGGGGKKTNEDLLGLF